MMSSSETVMNFRFDPFVREIRNMLFEGVTGITTCTAASDSFTTSKNFCFPASISSIHLLPFTLTHWSESPRVAPTSPAARSGVPTPGGVRGRLGGSATSPATSYYSLQPTAFQLPPQSLLHRPDPYHRHAATGLRPADRSHIRWG